MNRMVRGLAITLVLAMLSAIPVAHTRAEPSGAVDDPVRIMEQMYQWATQGKRSGKLRLTLSGQGGPDRVRTAEARNMRVGDLRRSLLIIEQPADSRGVGLLTAQSDDLGKPGERWLYLPKLGRSTRIAQTQMSGSFMGSDFTYGELSGTNPRLFNLKMENPSVTIDGQECWQIAATPKDADAERSAGYKSAQFWVIKSKMAMLRIRAQLTDGNTKYVQGSDYRPTGGQWHAHRIEARTVAGEKLVSKTVLELLSLQLNDEHVGDKDFTKQRLEQGI